jgi:hypothetical protein
VQSEIFGDKYFQRKTGQRLLGIEEKRLLSREKKASMLETAY